MKKNVKKLKSYGVPPYYDEDYALADAFKDKNKQKEKNYNYYEKAYGEYGNYAERPKHDINLDEYFRIRTDFDSVSETKTEEKNKKMSSGYIYRKNKMLVFQTISFFLVVIVLISGPLVSGKDEVLRVYESISGIERGFTTLASLPAAVYDKEVADALNAGMYNVSNAHTNVPNESLMRIFKKYNMKYIDQHADNMPNGCEVVSLTMVLSRYLPNITSHEISEKYLPRSPLPSYYEGIYKAEDPTNYYIGDPSSKGYGIFAPGLANAAQAVIDNYGLELNAVNISGCSEDELFQYISDGYPVIVWVTMKLYPVNWGIASWHLPNWKLYRWPGNEHCCVLVDYTDTTVTLYDPTNGIVDYDRALFLQRWNELGPYADDTKQAIVIK